MWRPLTYVCVAFAWLTSPSAWAAILLDAETLQPDKYAFQKKQAQAPSWEKKYKLVQVNTLVTDAQAASAAGNLDKAIELLERADELAQGAPGIHRTMIQLLLSAGRKEEVSEKVHIAQKQFPGNLALMDFLGDTQLFLGNIQNARVLYEDVLGQVPKSAPTRVKLGRVLFSQGDRVGAQEAFEIVIDHVPTYAEAHYALATLNYENKAYADAVAGYKKAVQLELGNPEYVNGLGAALFASGDAEAAIKRFREAIRYDRSMAKAHRNLGAALLTLAEPEAALDSLFVAMDLEIDSESGWQYFLDAMQKVLIKQVKETLPEPDASLDSKAKAAWCAKAAKKLSEAERPVHAALYLIKAILNHSGEADYLNDLGVIMAHILGPHLASPMFRGALLIDPEHRDAQANLAQAVVVMQEQQRRAVITDLTGALFKEPGNAELHHQLAMEYIMVGELTNAVPHLAKAVHFKTEDLSLHLDYIQGLYRVGQVEQAIKQCQKALVVLPDHPELQYRLAWLIMNQDKPDDLHLFYATEQLVRACNKAKKSNYFQLLAQVYQKTDRLELAKGAAKKAVEFAEDSERERVMEQMAQLITMEHRDL